MPEAIKTMQRALEAVLENEKTVSSGSFSSSDGEFEVITPVSSPSTTPAAAIVKRGAKLTRKLTGKGKSPSTTPSDLKKTKPVKSTGKKEQTESVGKRPGTAESTKVAKDTLDREFIESGIDALRRMSRPVWDDSSSEDDLPLEILNPCGLCC
jgi:hypothetical protein